MQASDRDIIRHMARECIAFRVRRASRVISRLYDRALADAGISATQLTLLTAVANRPDLHMAELADVLGVEPSALSRALALLVRNRWLKSAPSSDRRARYFEVTERGRDKLRGAYPRWQRAQAEVKRTLGPGFHADAWNQLMSSNRYL